MKLIIDIPEEMYQKIKETNMVISGRRSGRTFDYILFNAVNIGTPLPKGHGRLGDLDALQEEVSSWGMNDYEPSDFIDAINEAEAIIEADEAESEG